MTHNPMPSHRPDDEGPSHTTPERLKSGRASRERASAPIAVPPIITGDRLARLLDVSGILGYPAPRSGRFTGLVRLLQICVKRLMSPWFERQTRFNHLAYEVLHSVHHQVALLTERVNALQREVSSEVLPSYQETNRRLNECFHDFYQLRRFLTGLEMPSVGEGEQPHFDPVHTIEALFLHTRLPRPPARVLVCSNIGAHAVDLASLGFQVNVYGCEPGIANHPSL